jgi:RAD51-like protein 1
MPQLDAALGGGFAIGSITEVVGAAGAGKTQACLSACASAAHGLRGGVIYIDAEQKFSSQRLAEIAMGKFRGACASEEALEALTRRVQVVTPTSLSDLVKRLEAMEEAIIDHKVKLVIIDSVAHLARAEFGGREKIVARQSALGAVASTLKRHAEKHALAVLAVNQVTTKIGRGFEDNTVGVSNTSDAESTGITAALGTKWAHCVNTRLLLEVAASGERTLKIIKSPLCALTAFTYRIDRSGLCLVDKLDSATMRGREANVHSTHGGAS